MIVKHFRSNSLSTAIGDFSFEQEIGEGGNAKVLAFKKGGKTYAVKFLSDERSAPLARFRDEYFCAAQIPTHPNVSQVYHFDRTRVEEKTFSLIIMKRYKESLHKIGTITREDDAGRAKRGWKLLRDLRAGVGHLHEHGVVHRDIKPQNIFFDEEEGAFVIGDLGIAHFAEDLYAREAETEKSERLANFACCAPEQLSPNGQAKPTMDVFAIGQVLNWYIRGTFVRGGGRPSYSGQNEELALLDRIIEKCIQDDPGRRFQDIRELDEFESQARHPAQDAWKPIRDLDVALRASIPRVSGLYETSDQVTIKRFLKNFSERCDPSSFWYVLSDGGDNKLRALSKLECGRWLLHDIYECRIEKLICYKSASDWQSFFVLLLAADDPFEVCDPDGRRTPRPSMVNWQQDVATLYEGRYMDFEDAHNGFFPQGDEMVAVDFTKAHTRYRFLQPEAILIVPGTAGAVRSSDRTPNKTFLRNIAASGTTNEDEVRRFIEATMGFTDPEVTSRL